MPDGSNAEPKRLCENGSYFCKRDRNKAGTISIYTCKGRQTVRVASANTRDAAEAELALARFVLTNVEAAARERAGITLRDLHVKECINIYAIAREAFQESAVQKVRETLAEAERDGSDGQLIIALRYQVERAIEAARKESDLARLLLKNVERTWIGAGPTVSQMGQAQQKVFVKTLRKIGYADNTIERLLGRLMSAMHHCDGDERLLMKVPKRLPNELWKIQTDEGDEGVIYEPEEIAALFRAAAKNETWWRFMNMATHAARPMTIIETTWLQVSNDPPRWKLNPPGKRITKKRRPTIPVCWTLAAELSSWTHDHVRVITNGQGRAQTNSHRMFERLRARAGLKRGSAMSIRKGIRTWLMVSGVPDAIADLFMGHADEGSATGRKFYKGKKATYMKEAADAIEKLYDFLRPLVNRPFAGGAAIAQDQPLIEDPMALLMKLRGKCMSGIAATG